MSALYSGFPQSLTASVTSESLAFFQRGWDAGGCRGQAMQDAGDRPCACWRGRRDAGDRPCGGAGDRPCARGIRSLASPLRIDPHGDRLNCLGFKCLQSNRWALYLSPWLSLAFLWLSCLSSLTSQRLGEHGFFQVGIRWLVRQPYVEQCLLEFDSGDAAFEFAVLVDHHPMLW